MDSVEIRWPGPLWEAGGHFLQSVTVSARALTLKHKHLTSGRNCVEHLAQSGVQTLRQHLAREVFKPVQALFKHNIDVHSASCVLSE